MITYPYEIEGTIPKTDYEEFDGVKFANMLWPSTSTNDEQLSTPKGRILIVHGFGEYSRIYFRLMDQLSKIGYESFMFDQRGSGETSPGKLKGHTDEFKTFNDLDHFIGKNLEECTSKNIPLHIWGHSMGGGIILNYACNGKYKDSVSTFIASGPLVILHPHTAPNAITQLISPLLSKFLPRVRVDTGLDLDGITSDPKYKDFLANDPMSIPLYGTFRQIHDFLERGKYLSKNKNNCLKKMNKPLFIQHGQADTINDPKGSQIVFDGSASTDKKIEFYPNAKHSILSLETDDSFDKAFSDLQEWLDSHSP